LILGVILLLVIIIILLMVYNMSIHKKIQNFNNLKQKITNLNVLQDFMNTISEVTSVDEKIKKINDILIERYQIKYSTIVIYNGTDYMVKASNVDEKHWSTLKNLQNEDIFKDSIHTATPKTLVEKLRAIVCPNQPLHLAQSFVSFRKAPGILPYIPLHYWERCSYLHFSQ